MSSSRESLSACLNVPAVERTMGVGGVMMISGTWRRLSAERLPSAHSPCKHNLQPPRHDCPRPMVSSFGEVPEVKQNVDVQDCLRQGVFFQILVNNPALVAWNWRIQCSCHWVVDYRSAVWGAVLPICVWSCPSAPKAATTLSVSSLCPCTFSFPPKRPTAGSGRLPVLKVARKAQH